MIWKKLLESECSSCYRQSDLKTILPLSNAFSYYGIKAKPNIQQLQEVRSENRQLISRKANYGRLSVRLPTISPNTKHRYRYRMRPGLTSLKPSPAFDSDREIGAKTK